MQVDVGGWSESRSWRVKWETQSTENGSQWVHGTRTDPLSIPRNHVSLTSKGDFRIFTTELNVKCQIFGAAILVPCCYMWSCRFGFDATNYIFISDINWFQILRKFCFIYLFSNFNFDMSAIVHAVLVFVLIVHDSDELFSPCAKAHA